MRRLLVVVLLLLLWAPAARAWTWPVRGPVVQGFSFDKEHPYAAGQRRGIDIGSSGGVPVLAPASGTVTFAGSVPGNGMCVTIETADGLAVTLTHLGPISIEKGAGVDEGATIATVGVGGTSDGGAPYVHLGIRVASDANGYLDPLSLLPPATSVGSPGLAPASSSAPVVQQSSASAAPQAVADSSTTASSGTVVLAASGPPVTGASAPVEVPAADFAHRAMPASPKAAASPEARAAPTSSAAGGRERSAVVAGSRSPRRARAARAGTRGPAPAQRDAHAPAALAATHGSVTPSNRGLEAVGETDPIPVPRAARAPSTPKASHSAPSGAPRLLPWYAAFACGPLVALLLLVGALIRRTRATPLAPACDEAIVLALPRARRAELPREEQQLAA